MGNGNGLRVPYALRAARQIKGQSKKRGVKKDLERERRTEPAMIELRRVVDGNGNSTWVEETLLPAPQATSSSSSLPSGKPTPTSTSTTAAPSSTKPTPMSRALQYKPVKAKAKVESGDETLVVTKETATERARRLKREGKRPISVSNPLPTPPRTSVTPHAHRSPYPSPYLPSAPAPASAYPPSREHELEKECQRLSEQALAVQREAQAAEQLAQQLFASQQQQQQQQQAQHEAVDAERLASLKREESFRVGEALRAAEKKLEMERTKHRAAVEAIGREAAVKEETDKNKKREDLDKWSRMCGALDEHLARHIAMAGFVNQVYTAGGGGAGLSFI